MENEEQKNKKQPDPVRRKNTIIMPGTAGFYLFGKSFRPVAGYDSREIKDTGIVCHGARERLQIEFINGVIWLHVNGDKTF